MNPPLTCMGAPGILRAWLHLATLPVGERRAFAAATPPPGRPGGDAAQAWLRRRHAGMSLAQAPSDSELAAVRRWASMPGHHMVCLADASYPSRLRHLCDPPMLIYVAGDLLRLEAPMLAIVGSRAPSVVGSAYAMHFATRLAARGWTIVSGLAQGIDAHAHEGALEAASTSGVFAALSPQAGSGTDETGATGETDGAAAVPVPSATPPGSTVAVIGTGIDRVYPVQHTGLSTRIEQMGAVISEWPLGAPPRAAHFPQRNRLIAAMSHAVLVVEAALRSGSLITARLANELGREVFALPGSLLTPQSRGCHALIKEGATLVENVDDILGALAVPDAMARTARAPDGGTGRMARATFDSRPSGTGRPRSTANHSGHALLRKPAATGPCPLTQRSSDTPSLLPLSPDELFLLALIRGDPLATDVLCARTGWATPRVIAGLTGLEIGGHVLCRGGRFVRATPD